MRLKISSILAMAFFALASAILVSNAHRILSFAPGNPVQEQAESTVVWAAIIGLFAIATKLAMSELQQRQNRQEPPTH